MALERRRSTALPLSPLGRLCSHPCSILRSIKNRELDSWFIKSQRCRQMLNCWLTDSGGYSQTPPLHTLDMIVEQQPGSAREYLHRQESTGPEHLARRHPEGGRSQHDLRLGPFHYWDSSWQKGWLCKYLFRVHKPQFWKLVYESTCVLWVYGKIPKLYYWELGNRKMHPKLLKDAIMRPGLIPIGD